MGIRICGMNGSGKSTVGKAVAKRLGWRWIDNEDLYFPKGVEYGEARPQEEVNALLLAEAERGEDFVFAAVQGDYGEAMLPHYQLIVLLEVPKALRVQRVRERSFRKFGSRMQKGGDLYEKEEAFFRFIEERDETAALRWAERTGRPILRLDGTALVEESVERILAAIKE